MNSQWILTAARAAIFIAAGSAWVLVAYIVFYEL